MRSVRSHLMKSLNVQRTIHQMEFSHGNHHVTSHLRSTFHAELANFNWKLDSLLVLTLSLNHEIYVYELC